MIIRWGRKGIVAGAYAVAFVTAVAVAPTTTIKKVQLRPDIKQEVRHVTPVPGVITTSIKKVSIRPDVRQQVRHVTPVEVEAAPAPTPYPNVGNDGVADVLRDDREVIELVQVIIQSGILNNA